MPEETQYPKQVDLSSCEKEPIHIIGTTQSHGVLVACDKATGTIIHIGENSKEVLGIDYQDLLDKDLSKLLGIELAKDILSKIVEDALPEVMEVTIKAKQFILIPHFSGKGLILDIEPIEQRGSDHNFQKEITNLLNTVSSSATKKDLCEDTARITRSIFGYDRVMVYQFDEEWNGNVVAEKKNEDMESWLGLRYPASDIPKQARELFFKNKVRIISNVDYKPVKIVPYISPMSDDPLDLSNSKLRGISPIHIEYLQNMGVGASLTAALISNGKLWGLIACHHNEAKFLNYYQRQTCELLIQIVSNELSSRNSISFLKNVETSDEVRQKLVDQIQHFKSIKKGLSISELMITNLFESGGAAIVLDGKIKLVGATPEKKQVRKLIQDFLGKRSENLFVAKHLLKIYPEAKDFTDTASGILSIKLGQSDKDFLIWFRPEVIQSVSWGGDPNNKATFDEDKKRLTPRKSFSKWTEELKGVSEVWKEYEIGAAKKLSENISYVLLEKQKRKIDKLNAQITSAHRELELFSQGLSHDLKAPLRGVDGYAHILKEDHFADLNKEGRMAVDTILSSAEEMQDLIDNILSFAEVTNQNINKNAISADTIVADLIRSFNLKSNFPETKMIVEKDLPKMMGEKRMLTQVWSNLISNALKYSAYANGPLVEIGSKIEDRKTIYYIKDNGIGFEPEYKNDIFELFTRRSGDKFQGTGIGLAIVKRIIEKHGGMIWAESALGEGSTFYFYV